MAWLAGQKITAQRLIDNTPHSVVYEAIDSNSAAVSTTTETVTVTTASVNLRAGRAYKVALKCAVQSSVANDRVTARVRRRTVTGDVFIEVPHIVLPAAATNQLAESEMMAINDTASDSVGPFVATITRVSGSGAVLMAGSAAAFVGHIKVEDWGLASDFPNARPIT